MYMEQDFSLCSKWHNSINVSKLCLEAMP